MTFRAVFAITTVALVFGGLVVTGALLTAMPRPVTSFRFTSMDSAMARLVWDRLDPGELVIDSYPWRAVVLTGRLTRSAQDSSTSLESWVDLVQDPRVERLVQAGFRYAYVDSFWWDEMPEGARRSFQDDCVREVAAVHDEGTNGDRWLYDLGACSLE
jgi:hypothetical protein